MSEEQQLEKRQLFCEEIHTIVSEPTECAVGCLTLDKSSIRYGFLLRHSEDSDTVGSFGEFDPTDCSLTSQDSTLQQLIWFQDIGHSLVRYILCMLNLHDCCP